MTIEEPSRISKIEDAVARHGARFVMGSNCVDELEEFLGPECPLEKKYHALIAAVGKLCTADPENKTDLHSLARATDLSLQTLRVYADQLVGLGLFTKQSLRPKNRGRPTALYTMVHVDTFMQRRIEATYDSSGYDTAGALVTHQSEPDFVIEQGEEGHQQLMLLPGQPGVYRAEIFSTYTLLSVLRLGRSGRRTRGSYTADVHIGPAKMRIRVEAPEGYSVAGIIDTKALIGLCTYAISFYSSPDNARKPFVIDLTDFTAFLGLEPSGGNKRQVWKMVRAWEKTGFKIVFVDEHVRKLYGQDAFTLDEFRFIARIKTLVRGITPERFAVKLEDGLLERLLDSEYRFLSAIHPEIMREKSATRLLFYYWCRRAVKYKTTPSTWNIFHLHKEMCPYMEMGEFRDTLKNIFPEGEGSDRPQSLYGYLIRPISQNGRLEACEIWADRKDRLIKLYHQRNPHLAAAE